MPAYYNEHDPGAAEWLRQLISAGLIAPGDVDERSIADVRPGDLDGYTQCHFFAGIGGWSHALRLAGWPDDRPVWTGSCPCQPFSLAGQQKGFADERHLWPVWFNLICERRPARIFGEQVASASEWLGLVRGDLEKMGYAVGCIPFEAASAGADHLRARYGFVAVDVANAADSGRENGFHRLGESAGATCGERRPQTDGTARSSSTLGNDVAHHHQGSQGRALSAERPDQRIAGPHGLANPDGIGAGEPAETVCARQSEPGGDSDLGDAVGDRWRARGNDHREYDGDQLAAADQFSGDDVAHANEGECERQWLPAGRQGDNHADPQWRDGGGEFSWVFGADGKARRVKSGVRLLVDGFPGRVGLLRGFGNAIDPRAFALFIEAADEAVGDFVMTMAAVKQQPATLRNAAGEPPLGSEGAFFRDDQGEIFRHPIEAYRSPATDIGILELDNGEWLAKPPSFAVSRPRYASREQALRAAISAMIRRARKYARNKDGEGTQWSEGFAGRVIEWALSLKPPLYSSMSQEMRAALDAMKNVNHRATDAAVTPSGHPGLAGDAAVSEAGVTDDSCGERSGAVIQPSDPIVRALCEAKRARKEYPAGHTFGMTNPIGNGQMVTLGTCQCGDNFSYPYGSAGHEKMDAAIEAHWQKFDASPDKVDGRGQPIGAEAPPAKPKKQRKRKQPDAPEGIPASIIADAGTPTALRSEPAPSSPGAGSSLHERGFDSGEPIDLETMQDRLHVAAPIGAGSEVADGANMGLGPIPALGTAVTVVSEPPEYQGLSNAEIDPVREAGFSGGSLALFDDDDLAIEWPSYQTFLEDKIVTAPMRGIEVSRDALHPWLKPHCKDLTVWALRLGCAAIFANFGLHKTAMQLEWCRQLHKHTGQSTLCVVPLGVRHGFIKEALQLGMEMRFIRTNEEYFAAKEGDTPFHLTNYESVRDGKLNPNLFGAVALDEASVLRSYGSKTFQEFLPLFEKVPFKLVATATPSPNRYKELIHYAGFLGVMDTGLALTRWFQRNSEKAGDLTLYPHKADEFWMWVHSWAAFLQRPSELGYSDDGYELPPLKLNWHEVPADHSKAEPERDGQGVMFRSVANSLSEAATARRDSLPSRIAKMVEIIAADPDSHRVIWHDLEAEREAIEQALPGVVTIMGSMDIDAREERLRAFEEGETKHFATKPILSGSGSNFQYHCHKAIYVALPGYGYKFNDFIQSLYRLQRFGQAFPVEVDIIFAEDERAGRDALLEKWARDDEMRKRMSEIIKRHGLNTLPLRDALLRSIGVKRVEIKGERFVAINNDAVAECRAWPENSVDLMVSSIPFGTQYEYSASYLDFGHSDDNGHFWSQMDFLSSELLRMLKPGRLACIHVKDRIKFGAVTGQGVPTVEPFHAEAIMHYRAHGFQYLGMITVVTDVVRENNQTYRLGWSENAKDGTKMGCGMPEYILLLRKPQSDRSRSYADVPVVKSKEDYTRARWQIDAHAFWRSSGNRHLLPEEFAQCSSADIAKLFAKTTVDRVYDFEAHVAIGEAVERTGTLPATFMAIAPGSHHEDVWHDVNRMRTLNMLQQRKGAEMHLCPLQFDIVDRLIERYSNPDDLVFDPFGGLMTVPYRALLKGRRGAATELSATYFLDGVHYLHMAEEKMTTPQLFDLATFDAASTPPLTDLAESEHGHEA